MGEKLRMNKRDILITVEMSHRMTDRLRNAFWEKDKRMDLVSQITYLNEYSSLA